MKAKKTTTSKDASMASFRIPDAGFIEEIAPIIAPCISETELDDFDDATFDVPLDIEVPEPNSRDLRVRLDRLDSQDDKTESAVRVIENQATLFDETLMSQLMPQSGSKFDFEVSRKRFASLIPLVVQAFVDTRDGWSADYVLLSPDKDLEFLHQCWRLGAVAAPEELNWTLMNARKDGKLKGLTSEKSFSLSKSELDEFSFAAEMAIRELQEKARREERRDNISLDKLLCSPRLSQEFDSLARQVATGFSPLQYRWAAMTLRKARRLAKLPRPMPLFDELGQLSDTRPSALPKSAGIYWVSFEDRSAFVGVASDLRLQVDSFVGRLGDSATPSWVQDLPTGQPRLRLLAMPDATRNERELMRSSIFQRAGSRLNFKDASLFAGILNVA